MSLFGTDAAGRIASRMLLDDYDEVGQDELFSMSLRVPERVRAVIDSMAEMAGLSRNSMCIELLRAGIEDVISRLPDELRAELLAELDGGV